MEISLSWLFSQWILLMLGLGLILYFYGIRTHNFFLNRKIPYVKPKPFIGNMGPMLFQTMALPDYLNQMYNELKGHKYGGLFQFTKPFIMLRDPDLIKTVTVKDFEHFTDHNMIITEDADPMWGRGIFNLRGQRWKDMRSTLSPAFTSSKMKNMFGLVTECGKQLTDFLEKCCYNFTPGKPCKVEKEGELLVVELKDIFTRFTNDVIATAAFGVSVDSLMKPSNEFYLMGKDVSNFGPVKSMIMMGYAVFPQLMTMMNITLISVKARNFFRSLMKDTMTTREREGIVRPDLVQLLMLAKKGALQDEKSPNNNNKRILEDDDLAAQAFLFFLAGFDTTSTLLCFMCHQLAMYPEVQTRLQEEIDSAMLDCKGNISYETIHSMKYLDMVISETLRLYPPSVAADRVCTKPYLLQSDPPLQLEVGDAVWVPIYALHRDPEHFPDPEKFDPERFSDENKHSIKPFTYLPFGSGPRICIGSRFALMEVKVAMVYLLHKFNLKVVSRTQIPIQISKKGSNMTVDGGFWMGLEKRNIWSNN